MPFVSASFPRSESIDAPFFAVGSTDAPDTATGGDTVTVTATVENIGSATGTQDIQLFVDDVLEDTATSVSLDPTRQTTADLIWQSVPSDVGEFEFRVVSDDDQDTATIDMSEP